DAVYQTILDTFDGKYILPYEMRACPYSNAYPDDMTVYEIQKRAILTDPYLALPPKEAAKAYAEGTKASDKFRKIVRPKLHKQGIDGYFTFIPSYWDLVTDRLVAIDVI